MVDDEPPMRESISSLLQRDGMVPVLAHDATTALRRARLEAPEAAIVDVVLPDLGGMELLRRLKALDKELPVVMITGHAHIAGAVEAMRAAAHDYLAKPFQGQDLLRAIRGAVGARHLKANLNQLGQPGAFPQELAQVMGPSDAIGKLMAEVNRVAKTNFTVVLIGETGSGKEVVARALHQASPRAEGPFVPVDCGAIPETLLEGELFGVERGAFTGAVAARPGKFELAQGGTLFLDEILNLPLGSQAKLLRALQERTIYRLGGTCALRLDVRVVVAASQSLHASVAPGAFRADLYYRLNEYTLSIPALRQRRSDILYLARRFLDLTNLELGKTISGYSESALAALLNYSWPGNVRQLHSTIRRAVLVADDLIEEAHLALPGPTEGPPSAAAPDDASASFRPSSGSLRELVARTVAKAEREAVLEALAQSSGNKAQAARLLRIDYKTMQSKVKKYRIPLRGAQRHTPQPEAE